LYYIATSKNCISISCMPHAFQAVSWQMDDKNALWQGQRKLLQFLVFSQFFKPRDVPGFHSIQQVTFIPFFKQNFLLIIIMTTMAVCCYAVIRVFSPVNLSHQTCGVLYQCAASTVVSCKKPPSPSSYTGWFVSFKHPMGSVF